MRDIYFVVAFLFGIFILSKMFWRFVKKNDGRNEWLWLVIAFLLMSAPLWNIVELKVKDWQLTLYRQAFHDANSKNVKLTDMAKLRTKDKQVAQELENQGKKIVELQTKLDHVISEGKNKEEATTLARALSSATDESIGIVATLSSSITTSPPSK